MDHDLPATFKFFMQIISFDLAPVLPRLEFENRDRRGKSNFKFESSAPNFQISVILNVSDNEGIIRGV